VIIAHGRELDIRFTLGVHGGYPTSTVEKLD
jgi:hypothetical protein